MLVYLVRMKENKEVIGVFWGKDKTEIWWAIDEFAPADYCEYVTVRSGGIAFTAKVEDDMFDISIEDCDGIGDSIVDALDKKNWKPVNEDIGFPIIKIQEKVK
jgi:hypothetical protein